MVQLLESTTVLTKVGGVISGHDLAEDLHYFQQEEGPIGLFLQGDKFADLGSPDKLTVTIEPGDRLNV